MPDQKWSGTKIAKCQSAMPIMTQTRAAISAASRGGGCGRLRP